MRIFITESIITLHSFSSLSSLQHGDATWIYANFSDDTQ